MKRAVAAAFMALVTLVSCYNTAHGEDGPCPEGYAFVMSNGGPLCVNPIYLDGTWNDHPSECWNGYYQGSCAPEPPSTPSSPPPEAYTFQTEQTSIQSTEFPECGGNPCPSTTTTTTIQAPPSTSTMPTTQPSTTTTTTTVETAPPPTIGSTTTVGPPTDTQAPCQEDDPCWNCATMGNGVCGTPTSLIGEPAFSNTPSTLGGSNSGNLPATGININVAGTITGIFIIVLAGAVALFVASRVDDD